MLVRSPARREMRGLPRCGPLGLERFIGDWPLVSASTSSTFTCRLCIKASASERKGLRHCPKRDCVITGDSTCLGTVAAYNRIQPIVMNTSCERIVGPNRTFGLEIHCSVSRVTTSACHRDHVRIPAIDASIARPLMSPTRKHPHDLQNLFKSIQGLVSGLFSSWSENWNAH